MEERAAVWEGAAVDPQWEPWARQPGEWDQRKPVAGGVAGPGAAAVGTPLLLRPMGFAFDGGIGPAVAFCRAGL